MKFFAMVLGLLLSTQAHAYFATMDSGDVLVPGSYRAMLGPEYAFNGDNSGTTLSGRLDVGLTQTSTFRGLLGFGNSESYLGAFYKWVPYPDFHSQPAIGLISGVTYAHAYYGSHREDIVSLRLSPLVSKKFDTDIGPVTPYASLPLSMTFAKGETIYPVQIAIGSELKPNNWQNFSVFGELGVNVSKSFSYIEVAAAYYFGDEDKK